ncbi:hypothetical protein [Nonomuraea sp. 10N515B]|uniref:hypothetical protein n=1 Tax=Nonomuraea sp. 10N515B TaxID=3457422 RepID=UPI003FCEAAAD
MNEVPTPAGPSSIQTECQKAIRPNRLSLHEKRAGRRWRERKIAISGWLPAAAVTTFIAAVLVFYDVSVLDIVAFAAYLIFGLALPGTLLIRATYGGKRTLAEEVALGTALGYAIEVLAYIPARAIGLPLLVIVWPVVTYALFLAVPGLRRHWKGKRHLKAPAWWSWSMALIIAYMIALSAVTFYRTFDVARPELWGHSADRTFHLALLGELRHHFPPTFPFVAGEPLHYHWFVHAHLAAASWVTGVEPMVLLLRLGMLPMLAVLLILVAMTGRRLTRSWTGALLAVAGTLFLRTPNLYQGPNWGFTYGGIQDVTWGSPSQTFGALLFAPVVLLTLDLVRRARSGLVKWLLLGIFLIAIIGAKAIFLPLLFAGLMAVIVVEVVKRRPMPWAALAILLMTALCLLFSHLVLFGQVKLGMVFAPLAHMRVTWLQLTNSEPALVALLGLAMVYLLCWTLAWSGIAGLASRPGLLTSPGVTLMLGIGAAGLGVVLMFGHPGHGELYFLMGALPYLTIVAVYGLLLALSRANLPHGTTFAAIVGAGAAFVLPVLFAVGVPLGPGKSEADLFRPYVIFAIIAVLVIAYLAVSMGWVRAGAVAIVSFMAMSLPVEIYERLAVIGVPVRDGALRLPNAPEETQAMPSTALTALRWLRAKSRPDELIATNAHCDWRLEAPCNHVRLWVSAFTERRVLLEGWGYTPRGQQSWQPGRNIDPQFWDPRRFEANRQAFEAPSRATVRHLQKHYGVTWLFVDERRMGPGSKMEDVAPLMFRSSNYSVYRIPGDSRD